MIISRVVGHGLNGTPVPLADPLGEDATRRLWFARQAAVFVRALDVAELLGLDAVLMAEARRAGLRALVESVESAPLGGAVEKTVDGWLARGSHPTLDALFSVLWRAQWPVAELFPSAVRSIVEANVVGP